MVESISYYFWVKKLNKKGRSQKRHIQIDLKYIDKLYISYNPASTEIFDVTRSDSRMLLFNFNDISFNFSSDEISMTAKLPDEISMTAKPKPKSRVFKFIFDEISMPAKPKPESRVFKFIFDEKDRAKIVTLAETIEKKKNIHLLITNIKNLYTALVKNSQIDLTNNTTINNIHKYDKNIHKYDKNEKDETNIVRFVQSFPHFETPEHKVREGHPIITLQQILDYLNYIKKELDSVELPTAGGEIKSKRRKSRKSRKSIKLRKSKRRKSKRRKSRKLRIRKLRKSRKSRKSRR